MTNMDHADYLAGQNSKKNPLFTGYILSPTASQILEKKPGRHGYSPYMDTQIHISFPEPSIINGQDGYSNAEIICAK